MCICLFAFELFPTYCSTVNFKAIALMCFKMTGTTIATYKYYLKTQVFHSLLPFLFPSFLCLNGLLFLFSFNLFLPHCLSSPYPYFSIPLSSVLFNPSAPFHSPLLQFPVGQVEGLWDGSSHLHC